MASMDAVLLMALDGRVFAANPAACRMFGRSEQELIQIGRNGIMDNPDPRLVLALEEPARTGWFHGELTAVRKDGTKFPVEVTSVMFTNHEGHERTSVVIRDISKRKQSEEELHASHELLRSLAIHLQTVREEERIGLARELHDELGQGLTALQIDLAWLDSQLQTAGLAELPALRDKVAALVPRAERLIEKTQAISSTLRPGVLDDLGLVAAIEWLAADFERRTGLTCVATLPAADIEMDLARAVALFRIVQEALTNVIRHAQASRIEVRLRANEAELVLEVEDNGHGMAPKHLTAPRSLGLLSMSERAAAFAGTVDIQSEVGRGTILRVRMPQA